MFWGVWVRRVKVKMQKLLLGKLIVWCQLMLIGGRCYGNVTNAANASKRWGLRHIRYLNGRI